MTDPSEAQTRRQLIDPALKKTGWDVANPDLVRIEIPVDDIDPAAWKALQAQLKALKEAGISYDVPLPAGVTDYALYRERCNQARRILFVADRLPSRKVRAVV